MPRLGRLSPPAGAAECVLHSHEIAQGPAGPRASSLALPVSHLAVLGRVVPHPRIAYALSVYARTGEALGCSYSPEVCLSDCSLSARQGISSGGGSHPCAAMEEGPQWTQPCTCIQVSSRGVWECGGVCWTVSRQHSVIRPRMQWLRSAFQSSPRGAFQGRRTASTERMRRFGVQWGRLGAERLPTGRPQH